MKKILFLLLVVPFLIIDCESGNGDNLITFDNSALASELEEEGITPKLPTKFPVDITGYERYKPPHESERYETKLNGENGEIFTVVIHSGDVEYEGQIEKEDIAINGNEGFYSENKVTGPSIHWTDGAYHYIVEYQSSNIEKSVTKDTMLEIANSFE